MFRKIKDSFRTWTRNQNSPSTSPQDQLSPSELDQGIAAPSIETSSLGQQPAGAGPIARAPLHPVEQPDLAVDHIASTSAVSLHSPITQDCLKTGCSVVSSPPLRPQHDISQGACIETNLHDVQNNSTQGIFSNAHSFTIGNAVFYGNDRLGEAQRAEEEKIVKDERAEQERKAREEERAEREKWTREEREAEERKQEERALEKLAAKGMPGAMLDSEDRGYVPRCDEDTRKAIRALIVQWGRNEAEMRRLFWLSGPAGVGKSAIAQTVAEEFMKEGCLGAAFFFSRPNNRSDPNVLVATIAYQLALLLPEYRRIISQHLIREPLILNKSRRSQFKELIVNPFLSLMTQLLSNTQKSILIVLDGLDECSDRDARCEFVEMISRHAHKESTDLRLRWLICSRPEPDLEAVFSMPECEATCLRAKLEVQDSEAQRDARRILMKGFEKIRQKYSDQLTEDWPPEDQVHLILERASGHLGFVSFIVRFIGDQHYGNPFGQLDVCLKFLEHIGDSTNVNPLLPLDLLYTQILSDIHQHILPTTLRILSMLVLSGYEFPSTVFLANFLSLNQASFYASLRCLHSVLFIPQPSEAFTKPIRIHHASFSDYLKDSARSGKFVLEMPYLDITVSCLKWLNYGSSSGRVAPTLTWVPSASSCEAILDSLCQLSFTPCWKACIEMPEDSLATLFAALEEFDFHLDYQKRWPTATRDFARFIQWLATSSHNQDRALFAAVDFCGPCIAIWHRDDPRTFFRPFPEDMKPLRSNTLYFRIGKNNPTNFRLEVAYSYMSIFS